MDTLIERRSFSILPRSTFAINATGCLLIGLVIAALVGRHHTPKWSAPGSSWASSAGTRRLDLRAGRALALRGGRSDVALAYLLGSVSTGVVAVYAGTQIGRLL